MPADGFPLLWAVQLDQAAGNAAGYGRASRALRQALVDEGARPDPEAELVVHFQYPGEVHPWWGKRNVLFTMFENETPPPYFAESFAKMDALITPTEWNAEVFRRVTDRPVYVSPLGVDVAAWPGIRREWPIDRPFRWYWTGAHNPRKGHAQVMEAWVQGGFLGRPELELYCKTTDRDSIPYFFTSLGRTVEVANQVIRVGNVIVDNRVVPHGEMVKLAVLADAFVFPSMGEGWGLTLLEAMATGLPCVVPLHTGLTAFADEDVVVPVAFEAVRMRQVECDQFSDLGPESDLYRERKDNVVTVYKTNVDDLGRKMRWVTDNWHRASRIGARAHERAQRFTWSAAARRLLAVLREIAGPAGREMAC